MLQALLQAFERPVLHPALQLVARTLPSWLQVLVYGISPSTMRPALHVRHSTLELSNWIMVCAVHDVGRALAAHAARREALWSVALQRGGPSQA